MANAEKVSTIETAEINDEMLHRLITEVAKIITDSDQEILLSIDKTGKDKVWISLGSYDPKQHKEEEEDEGNS